MQLFSVYFGTKKSKTNQRLMTDSLKKCENYVKAREHTVKGFHVIRPADSTEKKKMKKSATVGGNKPTKVPHINRHGTTVRNGYISKNGFVEHT
jgi:hypothetical protein